MIAMNNGSSLSKFVISQSASDPGDFGFHHHVADSQTMLCPYDQLHRSRGSKTTDQKLLKVAQKTSAFFVCTDYPDRALLNSDKERSMKKQKSVANTDALIININDGFELSFWAVKFGVTKDEIRAAVRQAGNSLTAVKHHFALSQHV
ncbi:DUF3606 domain-containing protein [Pseudomonas simiae]|uniref:DUF3606 domain-containing protein n=2 Tax=Pseudomonas TaxID=286 RepID=UPI001C7E4DBF|nr:DUF3606 domain-containing protein [Pseudomonas simiae]WLI01052.1 DUF3606 domain-containing protein [Pseudomonas simiae]